MGKRIIDAYFTKERSYFENQIGREFDYTSTTGPYEYLLGALAGCFERTLISYLDKDFPFSSISIHVEGEKRTTAPTTLENTSLNIKAKGVEDKNAFKEAVKKAEENCSIFQTIKCVSAMNVDLTFED